MNRCLALCLLALLGVAPVARADEPAARDPQTRAQVEVVSDKTTCVVGEPFTLTLRVRVDLAFFAARAIALRRTSIDVPIYVRAPWVSGLPGTERLPRAEPTGPTRALALGDDIVHFRLMEPGSDDGQALAVLVYTQRFLPVEAGTLRVTAPDLKFAWATAFKESFFEERRPVDRHPVQITGKPLSLTVEPLPSAGRPSTFVDAVGRFDMRAAVGSVEVEVGRPFKLTLVLSGAGNLGGLAAPRLDGLAGLHVYGATDDRGTTARTIVYEVAVTDPALRAVPAIPFCFYDPEGAAFREIATAPIALVVRPGTNLLPGAGTFEAPGTDGPGPAAAVPPADAGPASEGGAWLAILLGIVLVLLVVALAWVIQLRRRLAVVRQPGADPAHVAREAAGTLARASEAAAGPLTGHGLLAYLSALLACPQAAVIRPDLAVRLSGVGVPEALATRTAESVEAWVAARYAGPAGAAPDLERTLVADLDAALS